VDDVGAGAGGSRHKNKKERLKAFPNTLTPRARGWVFCGLARLGSSHVQQQVRKEEGLFHRSK